MRFHHVGVSVADLDQARKWYTEVLGFVPGFEFAVPPIGLRGCFMTDPAGDFRVELLERSGSRPARLGKPDPGDDLLTRGYGHFAVVTPDLDNLFEKIITAGATPVWDPRPSPEPGVRMAFVADMDGNLIELVEGAAQ